MTKLLLKLINWRIKGKKPLIIDENYMYRWFIIPRNKYFNVYYHYFMGSDAPTMHDHPWWSLGIILEGRYIEHTPEGDYLRSTGDVTLRKPTDLHWIELTYPVKTLFITGPRIRAWGFLCNRGWVHWKKYIDKRGASRLANGCGEED